MVLFNVSVDVAPKAIGTIGNRGAKEGGKAYVDDILSYFEDDRDTFRGTPSTDEGHLGLTLHAWSEHENVATVGGNPQNKRGDNPLNRLDGQIDIIGTDMDLHTVAQDTAVPGLPPLTDALVIEGKSVGETMITVRVKDPATMPTGAPGLGNDQWVEHSFLVKVTEN